MMDKRKVRITFNKIDGGVEPSHSLATRIVNQAVQEGSVPNDWCSNIRVDSDTSKRVALRSSYKGKKLRDQVMKYVESVIGQLIEKRVSLK